LPTSWKQPAEAQTGLAPRRAFLPLAGLALRRAGRQLLPPPQAPAEEVTLLRLRPPPRRRRSLHTIAKIAEVVTLCARLKI
jgi:hypothetical protein